MVFFSATLFYAIMVIFGYVEFAQTWFVVSLGVDIVYQLFKFLIFSKEKDFVPFPKAVILYFIVVLFSGIEFSVAWFVVAILVDGVRHVWQMITSISKQ